MTRCAEPLALAAFRVSPQIPARRTVGRRRFRRSHLLAPGSWLLAPSFIEVDDAGILADIDNRQDYRALVENQP